MCWEMLISLSKSLKMLWMKLLSKQNSTTSLYKKNSSAGRIRGKKFKHSLIWGSSDTKQTLKKYLLI